MKRRLFSLLLCGAMLLLCATTAIAADAVPYLNENGEEQSCSDAVEIANDTTSWNTGLYVAAGNVTIGTEDALQRVTVTGNVNLILADGCTLTVNGGVNVSEGQSLTIYAQSAGTGKLVAQNVASFNAGIGGGGNEGAGGIITINGGNVTANGGRNCAGIGGGNEGAGGIITINGGNVTATGSSNGAGIGGNGGIITINGGTVTATGGSSGVGIGCKGGKGSIITINGGNVTANGGSGGNGGAGIGGGSISAGGKITISGGNVTATGSGYSAGIGGSEGGTDGGEITITGGTVTANGDQFAAGIGGGDSDGNLNGEGAGGTITISGGTVTANGGSGGAGIGGGHFGAGGKITISGGTVTANGGSGSNGSGAGIGGGMSKAGGEITISGGTVTAIGGGSSAGIGGGESNTDGTFSTGEKGNAFIVASSISNQTGKNGWSGVIFEEDYGEVYGNSVTLTTNAEIPENKTLNVPQNSTLTIGEGVTLTNKGAITNDGTIINNGTLTNNGTTDGNGIITGKKVTPAVTAPTAKNPTYTGKSQDLITAGSTTGGKLQYSLSENGDYSTAIPTGTNAGTYSVWYRVEEDEQYDKVAAKSITVSIAKADPTPATPTGLTAVYGQTLADVTLPGGWAWNNPSLSVGSVGNNAFPATFTPEDTANYNTMPQDLTVTVGRAAPTVKVSVATSGDTGARQAKLTVTVTGVANGATPTGTVTLTGTGLSETLTLSDGTASYIWTGLDGNYTVEAEYDGDSSYDGASGTKTFNANRQDQAALAINEVGSKTYGDPAFTLSVGGGSGTGEVTFESSDPTVIRIDGATATVLKAGSATITATKADDENYNEATATLTVTVEKKAIVFKAQDVSVTQNGTMPTFAYEPVTPVQGDEITTEPTAVCTAADTGTVGTFTITFGGAVLTNGDNYEISYQPGTLTVTAKSSGGGGGGGGSGSTSATYPPTVERPGSGGSAAAVSPAKPQQGDVVTVTPKPDAGYEVDKITVTDQNGKPVEVTVKPDGTYTFKQPIGKVTLEVTYKPTQTAENQWSNPFADVTEGAWYYEAVRFVQENGLMNGYDDGLFGPNDDLSRAQLAQILFNKEGCPAVNYLTTFSDVDGCAWYGEAVRWAAGRGVVNGYDDERFGPNDPVTREQLAVMLWRYSDSPAATDAELHFNDAAEISDFALEAMRWAAENGVVSGHDGGRLDPKGPATRAQVAQMLKNFVESVG